MSCAAAPAGLVLDRFSYSIRLIWDNVSHNEDEFIIERLDNDDMNTWDVIDTMAAGAVEMPPLPCARTRC